MGCGQTQAIMVRRYWRAKFLIESEYDAVYFRREVDAIRLHCEMFDDCVVHHEAVGVLAVIQS